MLKVLIADDERLERSALRRFVEEMPDIAVVGEARNGLETVRLAQELCPDLALVDIRMPGLSGLEAIRELTRCCPDMKSIIVTAYEDFGYAQQALRLGVFDYLLKPASRETVLTVLQRAVDALRSERERVESRARERLEMTRPLIQVALVLDLIAGAEPDLVALQEHAALVGLPNLPTVALAVSIDRPASLDKEAGHHWQVPKNQVQGVVCRVAGKRAGCVVVPMSGTELAVAVCPPLDGLVDTLSLAREIRECVAGETEVTVTIGVGRRAALPTDLSSSYEEALAAVRYGRLILGPNRVIHTDEVTHSALVPDPGFLRLEKELSERVRWGDGPGARAVATRLFASYLGPQGAAVDSLRIRLMELGVVLSRAAMEGGADYQQCLAVTGDGIWTLMEHQTEPQLRGWLDEVVERLVGLVGQAHNTSTPGVIQRVLEYLEQHYAEPISVSDMADRVYLNPSYFCRVFKRETGRTFVEYLTQLRMDRARDLLAATEEPVSNVARMVGFSDANYFSRVFVRRVGCSPLDFRKRTRGGEKVQKESCPE